MLFDLGSTYSYVCDYYATQLGLPYEILDIPMHIARVMHNSLVVDHMYRYCIMTI